MIKQLWNNIKLWFVQDQSTNHEDQQESVPDMLETVDMSILDAETTDTEDVELPDQIYTGTEMVYTEADITENQVKSADLPPEYDPEADLQRFKAQEWDYDGDSSPDGTYIWPVDGFNPGKLRVRAKNA